MTNASIYAAFERMWQHITAALTNIQSNQIPVRDSSYTSTTPGEIWIVVEE